MNQNNIESYKYRGIRATFDKDFKRRYEWVYGYLVIRDQVDINGEIKYYPTITQQVDYPGYPYGKLKDTFVIEDSISKCSGGKDIDGKYVYPGDLIRFVYGEDEQSLSDEVYVFDKAICIDDDSTIRAYIAHPVWNHPFIPARTGDNMYHKVKVLGNIFENRYIVLARDAFVNLYKKEDDEYQKGLLHDVKITVTYIGEDGKEHTVSTIANPSKEDDPVPEYHNFAI